MRMDPGNKGSNNMFPEAETSTTLKEVKSKYKESVHIPRCMDE